MVNGANTKTSKYKVYNVCRAAVSQWPECVADDSIRQTSDKS